MGAKDQWFNLRKELYRQVLGRIQQRIGNESFEIKKYRSRFDREFKTSWKSSHLENLLKAIRRAQIVLLADFHSSGQSQKSQLRLLKRFSQEAILAVECVPPKYQKYLDLYLNHTISDKEFLKKIRWQEVWGFPWENYRPIFEWAREHKVPIWGIGKSEELSFSDEDHGCFSLIKTIIHSGRNPLGPFLFEKGNEKKLFVIYGELHLSKHHLYGLLKSDPVTKKYNTIRVLQNIDHVYFSRTLRRRNSEIVQFDDATYSLQNVPPWIKWQSYLTHVEDTSDREFVENESLNDHVFEYAHILAKDFQSSFKSSRVNLHTAGEKLFWKHLKNNFNKTDLNRLAFLIEEGSSFYFPQNEFAFLGRSTVNHAAGLAAQCVLMQNMQGMVSLRVEKYFEAWIYIETLAYFGSKLINPHRKSDSIQDIRANLSGYEKQTSSEVLRLVLQQRTKHLNPHYRAQFKPRNYKAYFRAAKMIGGILGEKLFSKYKNNELDLSMLMVPIRSGLFTHDFLTVYYELMKYVEKLPHPFSSKRNLI